MSWVLRHSKRIYQTKIDELERFRVMLNNHLEVLQGYQSEIVRYWDDEHGRKYYELLADQIEAVRRANNRIERLSIIYQEATDEFTKSGGIIDDTIDEAQSLIKTLG